MAETSSFDDLCARLQEGDEQAAQEVFNRFSSRLIALARSRLNQRVQQKAAPEDVTQSVFRSFFVRQADGQFQLSGWDSLWSLLTRITIWKCGRVASLYDTGKRKSELEIPLDGSPAWEMIDREPNPREVACLTETLETLMDSLCTDVEREMVVLALQGYTRDEIGEKVGRTTRMVYRVLRRVREHLHAAAADDAC